MLTSQSPILLMIGLPRSLLPLYALPWLALGCTLWALRDLLRAPRAVSVSVLHRWSVFAALVGLLIALGLVGLASRNDHAPRSVAEQVLARVAVEALAAARAVVESRDHLGAVGTRAWHLRTQPARVRALARRPPAADAAVLAAVEGGELVVAGARLVRDQRAGTHEAIRRRAVVVCLELRVATLDALHQLCAQLLARGEIDKRLATAASHFFLSVALGVAAGGGGRAATPAAIVIAARRYAAAHQQTKYESSCRHSWSITERALANQRSG
jgi:hypothetical protein